jgi:O-antigen/teichoic acid export membrane protein
MFATFASFGMGLTATKHVAEYRETDPARAGRIIRMSSVVSWLSGACIALAMVAFAPWLAKHTLAAPQLTGALRVAAICLLFSVVNEAQLGALSGFEAFKRRSVIQFIAGLAGFPLAVAGVYWWGLIGALWGLTLSQALLVFLNFVGLRKEAQRNGVPIGWSLSRQELQVLWRFSLPTVIGAVVYVPAMWLANAIIVNTPNGYAEMGVFSAADRWRTAIRFLPTLLGGVALPMLSSLQRTSDQGRYYKVLWTNVKLSFSLSLAAAVPIALLAPWIMASYGHGFSEGRWVLVNLSAVSVITATSWVMGQILITEALMWSLFWLNLSWAGVLVLCCWLLRGRGAQGLATAYLVAEGLRLMCVFAIVRWRQNIAARWE